MVLINRARSYNQRTKEVKNGGGGGKSGGGQTIGHDYYADVAGLVCLGPVDAITEIWMDQERVWSDNVVRAPGDDFADIDIEKKGHITVYWGAGTQTAPDILSGILIEWDATSWRRHDFWQSFDEPYDGFPAALSHPAGGCRSPGLQARRCSMLERPPASTSPTPRWWPRSATSRAWSARVYARRRGIRSLTYAEQQVTRV